MEDITTKHHIELRRFACQLVLFQDAVARYYGLTPSDMAVYNLIVISLETTPKEIIERTGLSSGGVTKTLDHLELIGAIARQPSLNDRRSVVISPATTVLVKREGMSELNFNAVAQLLFSNLNSKEQVAVEKFLDQANRYLLAETDNVLHSKEGDGRATNTVAI
jgi:DNA-binding MarR family transcriptional regulator